VNNPKEEVLSFEIFLSLYLYSVHLWFIIYYLFCLLRLQFRERCSSIVPSGPGTDLGPVY
jgi:hypothetical protein